MPYVYDEVVKPAGKQRLDRQSDSLGVACGAARSHIFDAGLGELSQTVAAPRQAVGTAQIAQLVPAGSELGRDDARDGHRHVRSEHEQRPVAIRKLEETIEIETVALGIEPAVLERRGVYLKVAVLPKLGEQLLFDRTLCRALRRERIADARRLFEFVCHSNFP